MPHARSCDEPAKLSAVPSVNRLRDELRAGQSQCQDTDSAPKMLLQEMRQIRRRRRDRNLESAIWKNSHLLRQL